MRDAEPIRGTFVGRASQIAEITAALDGAARCHGGLVLIVGEAGIGKTAIAEHIASAAAARDIRVRWGVCWPDSGTPSLWPWSQLLDTHLAELDDHELQAACGQEAWAVATVAPRFAGQLGADGVSRVTDPTVARFDLFRALERFWERSSRDGPLLLIIEDAHWADVGSLLMLGQMASTLPRRSILVLATVRTGEVTSDRRSESIADLTGRASMVVPVPGLDVHDVSDLVDGAGISVERGLADVLVARTGGNPFFVTGLLRALTGATDTERSRIAVNEVPRQVADVVARRLARLPAAVASLLQTAAVLGPAGEVAILAHSAELDTEPALALLDVAIAAGVLNTTTAARWQFSHALVRDAVYDGLPMMMRRQIHARVLAALERPGASASPGELARHAIDAQPLVEPVRAAMLAGRAGRVAMAALAYETAAIHFREALDAVGSSTEMDNEQRAGLLLELGQALRCAGEADRARQSFLAVADISNAASMLTASAVGFASPGADLGLAYHTDDLRTITLFERALKVLPVTDSAERAMVLARLGAQLYFSSEPDRSRPLVEQAVSMARRVADPQALVAALATYHDSFVLGHVSATTALEGSAELLRVAHLTNSPTSLLTAHRARVFDLLVDGDMTGMDAQIAAFRLVADELHMPAYQWWVDLWRAMRLLLEGRLAEAEVAAFAAYATGAAAVPALSRLNLSFQIFYLRREQGRLAELEPTMRAMAVEQADVPAFGAALALLLAELGHLEECRSIVDRLSADQYVRLRDRNWPVSWFQLARAVFLIGDQDRASDLYQYGQALAGQCIMVSLATVSLGSADLALAWLADTLGDAAEADRWYRRAAVSNARIGARSWLAQTRGDHARSRATLDTDEAHSQATRLATLALDAAVDIGLAGVEAVARHVLGHLAVSPFEPHTKVESLPVGVFRREGAVWELAFAGVTVRVPHAKGLVDIARLLSQPAVSVHVSEMLPAQPVDDATAAARLSGSAGDILDERARREIRAHLADLAAEEDQAAAMNDLERASRIGAERDFLVHELAVAAGLHGRPRRLDDVSERARKTVTARIHKCITRIEQVHPALARHLDRSIDTGLWCVYRPEQPAEWGL